MAAIPNAQTEDLNRIAWRVAYETALGQSGGGWGVDVGGTRRGGRLRWSWRLCRARARRGPHRRAVLHRWRRAALPGHLPTGRRGPPTTADRHVRPRGRLGRRGQSGWGHVRTSGHRAAAAWLPGGIDQLSARTR